MNIEMVKRFVQMQTPHLLMSGINMLLMFYRQICELNCLCWFQLQIILLINIYSTSQIYPISRYSRQGYISCIQKANAESLILEFLLIFENFVKWTLEHTVYIKKNNLKCYDITNAENHNIHSIIDIIF